MLPKTISMLKRPSFAKPFQRAIILFILLLSFHCHYGQSVGRIWKQLDSLARLPDTIPKDVQFQDIQHATTPISIPGYFTLLGSNMKQQITAPFHASSKDWKEVGVFTAFTAALAFADVPIQKQAFDLRVNSATVRKVSRFITNFGGPYETYTLASLAAYGFLFKNEKTLNTTLLATQAYLTGGMIESVAKYLSGRQRPSYYGVDTMGTPRFHGPISILGRKYNGQTVSSSFPSGHTTVAFAAATVFAMEYRNKPWVPILSYSAASLIGVSRITENRHWATDVLVGAALGYLSGRQVVRNYHRYAYLKTTRQKPSPVSFQLQYNFGQIMPGLVYRFE